MMYVYLAIVAFVLALIAVCMFRRKDLWFQIDAALVMVTLVLRLLRVK